MPISIVPPLPSASSRPAAAIDEPTDGRGVPRRMLGAGSADIMVDPVLASDGHHYERASLKQLLRAAQPRSPLTGEVLDRTFLPAAALRYDIEAFLAAHPQLGPQLSAVRLQAVGLVQAAGIDAALAMARARTLNLVSGAPLARQVQALLEACLAPEAPAEAVTVRAAPLYPAYTYGAGTHG
jgi:hypothetical protein